MPTAQQTPLFADAHRTRSPAQAMSVVIVDLADALSEHLAAWEDLAAAALEPNVFFEPWMLLPAVQLLGADADLRFVLVYADDPPVLCGFFPFERQRRYRGMPLSTCGIWQHKHCFLGTPLVRASHAREALAALFDWLGRGGASASILQLPLLPVDGPFAELLSMECAQRGWRTLITDRHDRGLLVPRADAENYFQEALSTSSRRAQKRRQKRLAEQGGLTWAAAVDAAAWIEEFVQLEASGWKGRAGTALAKSASESAYFRTIVTSAAQRNRLLTLSLQLGGKPIGCRCAFRAGDGAFAFKSAYDEAFAAYSPGVMLELENIRQCHALPGLRWMDSCTSANNEMINRLWLDRRTLQSVAIAPGGVTGTIAITVLEFLQRLRRRFR